MAFPWKSRNFCCGVLATFTLLSVLTRRLFLDGELSPCRKVLEYGRWSHSFDSAVKDRGWNCPSCYLRPFTSKEVESCIQGRHYTFIGDSTARQLFWGVAKQMNESDAQNSSMTAEKHADIKYNSGGASIAFIWDPFLNGTTESTSRAKSLQGFWNGTKQGSDTESDLIIGAGLWFSRYLDQDFAVVYAKYLAELPVHQLTLMLPVIQPSRTGLSTERSQTLTESRVRMLNAQLDIFSRNSGIAVFWAASGMVQNHPSAYEDDGIHLVEEINLIQSKILLNYICNAKYLSRQSQSQQNCCGHHPSRTNIQLLLLCLATLVVLSSGFGLWLKMLNIYLTKPFTLFTTSQAFRAAALLSAGMSYCYLADRTPIFEKTSKLVDERLFLITVAISFLAGLATFKISESDTDTSHLARIMTQHDHPILPRLQTEEWKGWMQLVIILYHYFSMSQKLWIYQVIRLLVASYLFLTGYGHSMYFINTEDYSFRRMMTVLIRQNLLSCTLSYVMGTTYDFYYFPALASLWFLITWMTMYGVSKGTLRIRNVGIRITISIVIFRLIFNSEFVLAHVLNALEKSGMLKIDSHELIFRVTLDWQTPYYGMMAAVLYAIHQNGQVPIKAKVLSQVLPKGTGVLVILVSANLVFAAYFMICRMFFNKYQYNQWHPSISPGPILGYMALRNATPWLRRRHSQFFAWIGKFSLETFILQYHIWLAADTKALLHLGVFDRKRWSGPNTISTPAYWVEAVMITIIFLRVSEAMAWSTTKITKGIMGTTSNRTTKESNTFVRLQERELKYPAATQQRNAVHVIGLRSKMTGIVALLWLLNVLWYC